MDTHDNIRLWLDIHHIRRVDAQMKLLQLAQLQNRVGNVHSETPPAFMACRTVQLDEGLGVLCENVVEKCICKRVVFGLPPPAFVDVDLYTGVRINGSVSNAIMTVSGIYPIPGSEILYWCLLRSTNMRQYFSDFIPAHSEHLCSDAGVTGNVLFWETVLHARLGRSDDNDRSVPQIEMFGGSIPEIQPSSFGPAYLEHKNATHSQKIFPRSVDEPEKRGSVPFLPGFLNCPDVDDHIGADGTDNDPYSDSNLNTLDDAFERRSLEDELDTVWSSPDGTSNETLSEYAKAVQKPILINKYLPRAARSSIWSLYQDAWKEFFAFCEPVCTSHAQATLPTCQDQTCNFNITNTVENYQSRASVHVHKENVG
ncbi:hypothetical protein B0H14DRAFT_2616478 [Mycena olivaceomarginata]|nr:hypothetical protein B0H14DRAFT_2616478 [Mycena olivaceomarginata]